MTKCFYVTLYLVDRAYGGAEEGGWWFDYGTPVMHSVNRCFDNEVDACEYVASQSVTDILEDLNADCADINSVNCDGVYRILIEDSFPAMFPAQRPHYE